MSKLSVASRSAPVVGHATMRMCVDLDGTLIVGDLLWESFITLLKQRPWAALGALLLLIKGRARFKQYVAACVPVDPAAVLYRPEVLDHLRYLRSQGVSLVLATASNEQHAHAIADHLGLFDDVVASDGHHNLNGHHKAASLVERYGRGAFGYIGNDWVDIPVWEAAGDAVVVAASPRLARHVTARGLVGQVLSTTRPRLRSVGRALRPYQWSKNFLVFLPIIAAHTFQRVDLLAASVVAFISFSAAASAIYILNDISDVQADRAHPRKRSRPFAAGELSIPAGCVAAAGLVTCSFLLSFLIGSWKLGLVLVAYLGATTIYSLYLKRTPVADVFTLTGLYVLRIVAGGMATQTPLSSWLLAFALFFFLSLAFVKRYAELITGSGSVPGRGYSSEDASWMQAVGTTAGYMSALVLALYISSSEVAALYTRPQVLWLLCVLVLYWHTRLWFRASRRLVHDDPIVEAVKDWFSYPAFAAALAIMLAAI